MTFALSDKLWRNPIWAGQEGGKHLLGKEKNLRKGTAFLNVWLSLGNVENNGGWSVGFVGNKTVIIA